MYTEDKYAYKGIKLIFLFVSVLLMFPLWISGNNIFYRTLFIFLIGKVVDLFFQDESGNKLLFVIWDIVNQLFGACACAFSFCTMITDFRDLFVNDIDKVNIMLMAVVFSCVLKEVVELIYIAINVKILMKKKIENDISKV